MRIRDSRSQDEPHIDLVPLIDVILVLIIFFVVTTTFDARSTLQVQLPTASDQKNTSPPRSLSVLVNADGRYFINDQEVLRTDVEALKQTIAQVAGDDREQTVLLRADARTPYQAVVTAQDALGQLGFRRIAIATAPEAKVMSSTTETAWQTYKRLLAFAKPYRMLLLVALLGMLIEAAAGMGFLALMSPITNNLVNPEDINPWMPLAVVGLFLVRGVAGYLTDIGMGKAARSIARDLRVRVLGKYLRLPGQRFDNEPVPSMLVRLGSDSDQVAQAAIDAMKVVLQQSLQALGSLAMMFYYSWQVTLAIFVLAPPLAWVMNKVAKRYRRISHRIQESGAELLQAADQTLSSHQEVKIYGAQPREMERYSSLANNNLRLAMKVEATRSISSGMVQLIGSVGLATLLFIAGHEAAAGRLTVGDFVAMLMAMLTIIPALKQLTNVQNMTQRGIASAQRLFLVLDAADEPDTGTVPLARAKGKLEFRNVTARYPGQPKPALQDISFVAQPGTVTAIVGRSGSGKSTLIKLIPRFYDVEGGQILLDGHPLQDYKLADLRRQIALVGQQVTLFNGSVAENVAYGELSERSPEQLDRAIAGANALEFVEQMQDGMNSQVGAKGGRLSGGQRQRLAIARAMLKDAPILILDEATAALDNESERLVQDALQKLMPDRTTLVIAHRLSTIEHADQVLVMDQGRIVERGTHQQLLALGGLYEHLYRMQFRESQD